MALWSSLTCRELALQPHGTSPTCCDDVVCVRHFQSRELDAETTLAVDVEIDARRLPAFPDLYRSAVNTAPA